MNKHLKKLIAGSILLTMATALSLSIATAQTQAKNPTAAKSDLIVTFSSEGLQSLKAGNDELLGSGVFHANNVILKQLDGTTTTDGDTTKDIVKVDQANHLVTRTYGWGVISCTYVPRDGGLNLDVSVENKSDKIISGLTLQMLELKFPQAVKGFDDYSRDGSNVDRPTVVGLDYGAGTLAVANDDVGRPLYVGLPTGDITDAKATYRLLASSYHDSVFPNVWLDSPKIDRPIYPGETDRWHISVRVGPAGKPADDLAMDVYKKYAAAYPSHLNWPDRRPIGQLNLSLSDHHPPKNIRGWARNDKTIDLATDAGRQLFQNLVMERVDSSIPLLKSANAQGVIIWDIEGQEYSHPMSYLGDPRHLPTEMEPFADLMFKKLRDAGFRVGVCLRPQKAMKSIYGDVPEQVDVRDPAYELEDKIAYAKKRWGCTLFYVDSGVSRDPSMSEHDGNAYKLESADIFEKIALENPDCLIIPEQVTTRYYAYTASYQGFVKHNVSETPLAVRRVYPNAFSVITLAAEKPGGVLDTGRDNLIAAVKRGDILMFRCWFETPELQPVRDIYKAAGK